MTMNPLTRLFRFQVRPRFRETLDSYSKRVLAANLEEDAHRAFLLSIAGEGRTVAAKAHLWARILARKVDRPLDRLATPDAHGWLRHSDGTSCPACARNLPHRSMCTLCSHGERVEQSPHFDDVICVRHHRWVGVFAPRGRQRPLTDDLAAAGRTLATLRRKHRIDVQLYTLLARVVGGPFRADEPAKDDAAAFSGAMRLAAMLNSIDFQLEFFDPSRPFTASFELLESRVNAAIGRRDTVVTRALWLYLRPSVAALRRSATRKEPYVQSWAHDLRLHGIVVHRFEMSALAGLEAFEHYLERSGDTPTSAEQFAAHLNLSRVAAGAESRHGIPRPTLLLCERGHEFEGNAPAPLRDQTFSNWKHPKCPACTHRVLERGFNDLKALHPDVACEFDVVLNAPLTASEILPASRSKYVWRCARGHTYEASPQNRTSARTGCPVCTNHVVVVGVNDALTTHPHLAADFHPDNPAESALTNFVAGSNHSAQWLCADGHSYTMSIVDRSHGHGCPPCARVHARLNRTSLVHTHPALAAEWDEHRNKTKSPDQYSHGSREVVWWVCPTCTGSYSMRIESRARGYGCKYCSHRALLPGTNDLATTDPVLAAEYHPYLNDGKAANETLAGNKAVWWTCKPGSHQYRQTVQHRRQSGGCPLCQREDRILHNT